MIRSGGGRRLLGVVADPERLVEVPFEHEHHGQGLQHLGTGDRRRGRWDQLRGPPQLVDCTGHSGPTHHPAGPSQHLAGENRLALDVDILQRRPRQRRGTLVLAGLARLQAGSEHQVDSGAAGHGLRIIDLVPQLQATLEHQLSRSVGVDADQLVRGAQGPGEGTLDVVCEVPVVGDRRRHPSVRHQIRTFFQRTRITGMETRMLAWEHVVVDGFPEQGMPEAVAVAVDDDDTGSDGVPQRRLEGGDVVLGDGFQHRVVNVLAGQRHQPQELLGRFRQRLDPYQQQVPQRARKLRVTGMMIDVCQLLDVERHPFAALEDPFYVLLVDIPTDDAMQLIGDMLAAEPSDVQPYDAPGPVKLGEQGAQRVPPAHLVGPGGQHQQDRSGDHAPHDEPQEVAAGAVCPLQILDDRDERAVRGDALEQSGDDLIQPAPPFGRLVRSTAQLRQERGERVAGRPRQLDDPIRSQPGEQTAQEPDHRNEGHLLAVELNRLAHDHQRTTCRRLGGELLDQARLADAGLTAHQDGRRFTGENALEGGAEFGKLALPPDHRRLRRLVGHTPIVPPGTDTSPLNNRQMPSTGIRSTARR